MHCNVWHDKNLCSTNLYDRCLTRIIRIHGSCINLSLYDMVSCLFVQVVGVTVDELAAAQKWNGAGVLNLLTKHPL